MTITGRGTIRMQPRTSATALVIIAACLAARGAPAQVPAQLAGLTTAKAPAPAAPLLATVFVDGSAAYDAARLFATYRDQLGRPISREGARAVVDALLALYDHDGYVRPEIRLDDSLTGRGVLRVRGPPEYARGNYDKRDGDERAPLHFQSAPAGYCH